MAGKQRRGKEEGEEREGGGRESGKERKEVGAERKKSKSKDVWWPVVIWVEMHIEIKGLFLFFSLFEFVFGATVHFRNKNTILGNKPIHT